MGGKFTGAAFTITFTVSSAMAPKLSVTFSWNEYTPAVKLLTIVMADVLFPIAYWVGPLNLVHRNPATEPSGSLDALPFIVTEFIGKVIFRSAPAFAIG